MHQAGRCICAKRGFSAPSIFIPAREKKSCIPTTCTENQNLHCQGKWFIVFPFPCRKVFHVHQIKEEWAVQKIMTVFLFIAKSSRPTNIPKMYSCNWFFLLPTCYTKSFQYFQLSFEVFRCFMFKIFRRKQVELKMVWSFCVTCVGTRNTKSLTTW